MLPIRDTVHARYFPFVNYLLIAANAVVFFIELGMPTQQLEQLIATFGLIPAKLVWSNPLTLVPLLTHMFLHSGWLHFVSNVWILFIFGDNVEDRLGSFRYLVFYILGGVGAGLLQSVLTTNPNLPAIGASGAIAAVMGAYFLFFPTARVITLIPLFFVPWFVEIPAIIYLGFWFVSQLFSGVLSLTMTQGMEVGGVAWWAHIGGFIMGLILAKPFEARRRRRIWYPDEYYPW
ncbi:MAG: rhomboid family intramembrane serine protease [Anaerolineae bacterium]|nr:rhomboid family intramembrane serine protease [Anaerolineae bacterium]